MATAAPVLCVPMHLQAFTLNDSVASDSDAKIAPITQPNYTFLRFNENLPASDVQDNVDLHWTSPASRNSRVTDLGTGLPRSYRKGIYLSWTLPRFYRSGSAASANNPTNPGATSGPDSKVPIFRAVPTRWLIVRHIAPSSIASAVSDPNVATKLQNTAWVVESNRVWTIQDLDNLDDANQATQKSNFVPVDLQVDVSPFISPTQNNDKSNMAKQSEIFLGCKTAIEDWKADSAHEADGKSRIKPLSLLNSSNPFFADFQHHNGNCFSMLDGFGYLDAKGNVQHLQTATASYYVLGWHADSAEDPLAITKTAAQRLQDLNLIFNGTDPGISGWFTKSTATLCHGALYQVMWDLNKLPSPLPAKVASNALNAATPNEPISVGTTPTDALIAYVAAHQDTDTGDLKKLENDIWALRQLLVAQNDSADALLEAHDQLSDYGFERSDGGGWWHFSGGSSGTNLSQSNKDDMVKLSQLQVALDNTTRALQSLQWQLFAVWWRLVTGASDGSISGRANIKQKEVTPLITRMKILQGSSAKDVNSVLWLRDQIQQMTDPKKDPPMGVEKATSDPFFLTKEPTLLLGGISAGWPSDYLDPLSCRMDGELSTTIPNVSADWASLVNTYGPNAIKKLPASISTAATSLLYEFAALSSSSTAMAGGPLYHDPGALSVDSGVTLLLRDQWSGQPWFPLFVEWEAEYYHIPYNTWTLDPTVTLGTSNTNPMLQYGIGSNINLSSGTPMEERVIQGRTLLLPQPGFSLQNSINQVLQKMTDEDLTSAGLAPAERTFLNTKLAALPYLSMPLSGLRQHLTTRIPGSHIKPNQREPGQIPTPMDASTDPNIATVSAGLDSQALNLIGTETALTPYGRGLENLATVNFDKYPLFKPVTHGQLRFKHLNVIDKFGQAICALDPTPSHLRQHVAPALADNYKVQALADGTPNVVIKDVLTDNTGKVLPKANEFIQLGPRINQPARINAEPVVQDSPSADAKGKPRWRPAYGWENPIYGWVVNNYLDNSIQIFEQDGTFYREITLGGFSGDLVSPAWLPFEKPAAAQVPSQLDQLVAKLADKTYLQAFMNMLNASTNDLPPAPATYAQFMNAIISKPLALVNLGWSLELSSPPMHNESTLVRKPGS